MRRHASFRSAEEFRSFLTREVPRHAYYSSAYYRTPDGPTMAQKEWLGADVIFDLDADHLRQAAERDYAGQLALAKEKFCQLVDDYLLGDFGIDPAQLTLVFSGGRGYHAHVRDPSLLDLTSAERRELVDYVLGTGVEPTAAVEERRGANDGEGGGSGRRFRSLRDPESGGWGARISRALLSLLERWERLGAEGTAAEMVKLGIPKARATRLARQLVTEGRSARIRETRALDVFRGELPQELLDLVLRGATVEVQGETDAPVTTDIHRLIRLPNSLHGGTGLRVVPLDRDSLDGFEPLRDAAARFPDAPAGEVELASDVDHPFGEGRIQGRAGERLSLPPPEALFLVLRGEAMLRPAPAR